MTKVHQPLYLYNEDAATLKELAAALGSHNQRGQNSVGALCEELAQIANGAFDETVWLLEIARQVAMGGDLAELLELTPLPEVEE